MRLVVDASAQQVRHAVERLLAAGSPGIAVVVQWPGGRTGHDAAPVSDRYSRKLPIARSDGGVRLVDVATIDWIEAANQYVWIHVGRNRYLIRRSLTELARRLPSDLFLRIHRSTVVNLDRIEELQGTSAANRWVVLKGGDRLRVSPRRWPRLRDVLIDSA